MNSLSISKPCFRNFTWLCQRSKKNPFLCRLQMASVHFFITWFRCLFPRTESCKMPNPKTRKINVSNGKNLSDRFACLWICHSFKKPEVFPCHTSCVYGVVASSNNHGHHPTTALWLCLEICLESNIGMIHGYARNRYPEHIHNIYNIYSYIIMTCILGKVVNRNCANMLLVIQSCHSQTSSWLQRLVCILPLYSQDRMVPVEGLNRKSFQQWRITINFGWVLKRNDGEKPPHPPKWKLSGVTLDLPSESGFFAMLGFPNSIQLNLRNFPGDAISAPMLDLLRFHRVSWYDQKRGDKRGKARTLRMRSFWGGDNDVNDRG